MTEASRLSFESRNRRRRNMATVPNTVADEHLGAIP